MRLNDLLYRWRALFKRDEVERELDDELRFHVERHAEKLTRQGIAQHEAMRQARMALGGPTQAKERCRDARGTRWIEETWQDLRYSLRTLRLSPAFAITAVVTLALGTGANTTAFSGLNTILFRTLPVERPNELVAVSNQTHPPLPGFSYDDYLDFRDRNTVLTALVGYRFFPMSLTANGRSERLWGYVVTGNYFQMLGVKALIGRTLTPDDDGAAGAHPVAVISYNCWQRRFGGDHQIIGRTARINGFTYSIVGVAPRDFFGTEFFFSPDVWTPTSMLSQIAPWAHLLTDGRSSTWLWMLGRLKPGVTAQQAETSLRAIAADLGRQYPNEDGGQKLGVNPPGMIGSSIRSSAVETVAMIMGIAAVVLLVACTNLAGLLLARASVRRREIALRLALGAGQGRLVRQLFAESALLSLAGCAAGLLLAYLVTNLLTAWHPPVDMQVRGDFAIDVRGLCFMAALAVAVSVVFGLAPALAGARVNVALALKGSAPTGRYHRWAARDLLIAAQVALSMVLLVGASLVSGGIRKALSINLGFDPANTVVSAFDLTLEGYDEPRGREFERRLIDDLQAKPGIESVSLSSLAPLDLRWLVGNIFVEGSSTTRSADVPKALFYQVTPGYFRTLRTHVLAGRDFDERDRPGGPHVAVVNETFATTVLKTASPMGKRFRLTPTGSWIEVIGLVEAGKHVTLAQDPVPVVYEALWQDYNGGITVALRSALPPGDALGMIRRAVARLDPSLSIYDSATYSDHLALQLLPSRSAAAILSGFGALALLLSATGIYGVVAYAVSRRTREIGIRMAIGAGSRDIVRLVVGRVAALLCMGMLLGIAAAALATPLLIRNLFGVPASNPFSFAIAAVAMASAAALACWTPARRALAIDPASALRSE